MPQNALKTGERVRQVWFKILPLSATSGDIHVRYGVITFMCVCCLAAPVASHAQSDPPPPETAPAASDPAAASPPAAADDSFWRPFKLLPQDVKAFFSKDTARILGVGAAGVMVAHRWDDDGIAVALGRFQSEKAFMPGNIGGGIFVQVGGSFVVYALGRATGSDGLASVGSDLFRAQLLTQAVVQPIKLTFRRERPDGSSRYSMPSGHAAGATATATVLQRRFGWKVGIPAYTASAYVAASRMSANKHHLTDVMVGAAIGIASGYTTTIEFAKNRYAVGVTPRPGGAAVTITKQQ